MSYHPLTQKITQLLQQHNCWFETFEHQPVRTSQEAAQVRIGYTLEQGAKALLLRVKRSSSDAFFAMLVLPGNAKFDGQKVKAHFAAKDIRFATEAEVASITGGVQPGGVPPFGNLFGVPVIVDPTILQQQKIIFNAGDRSFSVGMLAADYQRLVGPQVVMIL